MKRNKLPELIRRIMLTANVDAADYAQVKTVMAENNRTMVMIFSTVTAISLLVLSLFAVIIDDLQTFLPIYFSVAIAMLLLFVAAYSLARNNTASSNVVTVLFVITMLALGILIGTVGNPNEITASYIAILLAVPLLITCRPLEMVVLIILSNLIFVCASIFFKDPVTWNTDIINCLTYGTLSAVASTWMMIIKVQRLKLELQVERMAGIDLLTELNNRNSYEQWMNQPVPSGVKSVFCVYVDVNGLHEMNDTQGHDAGDRMLKYVATSMREIFGRQDTYRIGGDEFVAIGYDMTEKQVQGQVLRLQGALQVQGYHAAIGLSSEPVEQLVKNHLVRSAEIAMYDDKRDYYVSNGLDRRRSI